MGDPDQAPPTAAHIDEAGIEDAACAAPADLSIRQQRQAELSANILKSGFPTADIGKILVSIQRSAYGIWPLTFDLQPLSVS